MFLVSQIGDHIQAPSSGTKYALKSKSLQWANITIPTIIIIIIIFKKTPAVNSFLLYFKLSQTRIVCFGLICSIKHVIGT